MWEEHKKNNKYLECDSDLVMMALYWLLPLTQDQATRSTKVSLFLNKDKDLTFNYSLLTALWWLQQS